MIRNRTAQLIYQTIYCTLGLVGIFASLGIFDNVNAIRWDFYVHFTNLSNFLCVGVMLAALIQTARKKEDSYVTTAPLLKFIGMLGILLTFLVFNILLAGEAGRDPQANWRIGSLCFHVILPVMYVFDWLLFYEHRKVRWFYPLASVLFPVLYVAFVYVRAAILNFNPDAPYIYPYFFLNIDTQGLAGVTKWVVILFSGFIFYGIDKLIKSKK